MFKFPEQVVRVVEKLQATGGRVMLVGGAVVDVIRGTYPVDFDLEVFGMSMADVAKALAEFEPKATGKAFGIYKCHVDGLDIDVSVPRRDNKIGNGHADFEVAFDPGMLPEEAARRRDFTINSMFYDMQEEMVVDPFNGREDLEAGILRATDKAKFVEDPVRALRAMQLLARKAESVHHDTIYLISTMVDQFQYLAKERVFEEWKKLLLKADVPSMGLELLRATKWLANFPELEALVDSPENVEWHPEAVPHGTWNHVLHVVNNAATIREEVEEEWRLAFMFGALLHDVGKPSTVDPRTGKAPRHDREGVPLAEEFMRRITDDKKLIQRTVAIVGNHMGPFSLTTNKAKPTGWKRLHNRCRLDMMGWMSRCDWAAKGALTGDRHVLEAIDHVPSTMCFAYFEEFGAEEIQPILQGRHLIKAGWMPGPKFGPALKVAYEAQLEGVEDLDELLKVAAATM
jgi:tRNA nucleotidyltransferase (CCA-adding enzyme)